MRYHKCTAWGTFRPGTRPTGAFYCAPRTLPDFLQPLSDTMATCQTPPLSGGGNCPIPCETHKEGAKDAAQLFQITAGGGYIKKQNRFRNFQFWSC